MTIAQPVQKGWSIAALAKEFDLDRRTASARIDGVRPCGTVNGKLVYALRDVAALLVPARTPAKSAEEFDPTQLEPKERRDYYASEVDRLRVEEKARHLIPAADVEREMAALIQPVAAMLETLPDLLERDCDLTPVQVERVQVAVDAERARLHEVMQA